jgi:HD superfamily phosphohydrolase
LIGSLCVNEAGDGLALTEKGRTAAEMMVFSRYVMFSEVYWHHAVRSATAMLQRAFYMLHGSLDLDALFRLTQREMIHEMQRHAGDAPAGELLLRLFGPRRQLYKRCLQLGFAEQRSLYEVLARRPYPWLVACGEAMANLISQRVARRVAPHEMMIDAPPVKLEVQCNVEIFYPKEQRYRRLAEVSPVVHTLANDQFDNFVKRVRVFVAPELVDEMPSAEELREILAAAIEQTED